MLLRVVSYRQAENVKSVLSVIIFYSGIAFFLSLFLRKGASILLYHSVGSSGVFQDNVVREDLFQEQIAFLKKKLKVVPLADIVDHLRSGRRIPSNWVAITFDDGYRDNRETALPILKDAGLTATFYPTVDVVENGAPFFYDVINAIVKKSDTPEINIDLAGGTKNFSLRNAQDKEDAILRIVLEIRKERPEKRREFVEYLKDACDVKEDVKDHLKDVYMTISQIRELGKNGMEIGSHSLSHPNLTTLTEKELTEEVENSKKWLETILGKSVKGFSYPFGKSPDFNDRVLLKVRGAGYMYAVSTKYGKVSENTDLFVLPRIGVRNASLCRLKVNLLGIPL